jgi:predicted alpha-1,2-mannosidase
VSWSPHNPRLIAVVGGVSDSIAVFSYDSVTRALVKENHLVDTIAIDDPRSVSWSPHNPNLIAVVGDVSDSIAVFSYDSVTRALVRENHLVDNVAIDGPRSVSWSPHHPNLIAVVGDTSDSIAVFSYDNVTRALVRENHLVDNVAIDRAFGVSWSPHNPRLIAAVGFASDSIAVFSYDNVTRALVRENHLADVTAINDPRSVSWSPHHPNLIAVVGDTSDSIAVFSYDNVTKALVRENHLVDNVAIDRAFGVSWSPHHPNLIAAVGGASHSIAVFSYDNVTRALVRENHLADVTAINDPRSVSWSPHHPRLIAAVGFASDTIAVFGLMAWRLIATWTGTVSATAEWRSIATWTGTVSTIPAEWRSIATWTGTVHAPPPPTRPVLRLPENDTTTTDNTPTFTWTVGAGADNHHLFVDNDPGFTSPEVNVLRGATDNTFTVPTPLPDENYFWRVVAINPWGENKSVVWTFVIDTVPPAVPTLVPFTPDPTTDNTPTLGWGVVVGAVFYHIQIDNDAGFLSPRLVDDNTLTASTFTPVAALPDGTIFWRVMARDNVGNWSAFSAADNFVIDTVPPAVPTLVPFTPDPTTDNTPTLGWGVVVGAVFYHIQIDNDAGFLSPRLVDDNTLTASTFTPVAALPDGTIFWRVMARDNVGNWSAFSAADNFVIDTVPPAAFNLLLPVHGATTTSRTPTLTWENSSDDGSGLARYEVWLNDVNVENVTAPATSYITPVLPLGTHRWHVVAVDNAGNRRRSENTFTFTVIGVVDTTPPVAFTLLSPANGATITDITPTLTWENSSDNESGLARYEVWLNGAKVGTTPAVITSHTTSALLDGSYTWFVVAVDHAGNRRRSLHTFTFTVPRVPLINYVNPFIGTKWGHISPGSTLPFARTAWHPVRAVQASGICIPYRFGDNTFAGFRGSHFPSGAVMSDYACVTIMPVSGPLRFGPARASGFCHRTGENASPGYYAVTLADYDIRAEVTSTMRAGIMRFTFNRAGVAHILVDAHERLAHVNVLPGKNRIVGFSTDSLWLHPIRGYFVVEFSRSFTEFGTWRMGNIPYPGTDNRTAPSPGAWASFTVTAGETITVRASISFISIEQAIANLRSEIPDWDFKRVRRDAESIWENALGMIRVASENTYKKTIFYSALYRALLLPRVFSENGRYWSVFDRRVHTVARPGGEFYNDFSMWDTFRAQHPLLILLVPGRVADMMQSLVDMFLQGGWIPKWPNPGYTNIMIGTHADSMITEAFLKGVTGFDVENAYRGMLRHALDPLTPPYFEGRQGLSYYKRYGFVPANVGILESASITMESAFNDWCVAQLARALGRDNEYRLFMRRAHNWRNVIDNRVGFVHGRNRDGSWVLPLDGWGRFDPGGYYPWMCHPLEGNPWQYTWFVPHDVWGLRYLIDGAQHNPRFPGDFTTKLENLFRSSWEDELFAENRYTGHGIERYYWHGNQPSQHVAYLFAFAGKPWRTQYWVNHVLKTRHRVAPFGLVGNDDAGQTSAWYIFSAMGFYPVNPASLTYVIGRPLFDKVEIRLGNGNIFVIESRNVSPENMFIQSATLDGRPLNKPWFDHRRLADGGTLTFTMGRTPNKSWGRHPSQAPPSMTGPRFAVENLRISPSVVRPGETVTISVDVANVGTHAGPKLLELEIGGSIVLVVDNREVAMSPGESRTISFTVSENRKGTRAVYLGALSGSFMVHVPLAGFRFENLRISPSVVRPGENVVISVGVANVGDNAGTALVVLKIDNRIENTRNVTLRPRENTKVLFTVSRTVAGTYRVSIENLSGSFEVKGIVEPAKFVAENLVISPRSAAPGETVTISVDVANVGGATGPHTVILRVNGLTEGSETVTLMGGGSTTVRFEISKDVVGSYLVDVNGLAHHFWVIELGEVEAGEDEVVGDIQAGQSKEVTFEDVLITSVKITARNTITNESILVRQFVGRPGGVPPAPGIGYRYLSIIASRSKAEDIETVVIGFKVNLSRIAEKGIDINTIVLYRYDPENERWENLQTRKVRGGRRYAYFEAVAPRLSIFAVRGLEAERVEPWWLLAVLVGIPVGVGLGVGYFLIRRRTGRWPVGRPPSGGFARALQHKRPVNRLRGTGKRRHG